MVRITANESTNKSLLFFKVSLLMSALTIFFLVTTKDFLGWKRREETLVISPVAPKVLLTEHQAIKEGFLCLTSCLQRSASFS